MASSLLSGLSGYVDIGLILLWIYVDTFVPVSSSIFTRSFAVVLGLICTFRTKVRSSLEDRMRLLPERCDGFVYTYTWCLYLHIVVCTLHIVVCTDERGTFRCLEIAPKDEPEVYNFET